MKIPTVLMASLLAIGVAGQTSKPVAKNSNKPVKKVRKAITPAAPKKIVPKTIAKRDTVINRGHGYCPACGMG